MLESCIFMQISAKFLPKTNSSTSVKAEFWDGQFCKRLSSTNSTVNRISIKTLEKY